MRIVKADCGSGAELGEGLAEAGREVVFVLRDAVLLTQGRWSQGPLLGYQARVLSPPASNGASGWPASEPHPKRKQQPLPSNSRILHSDRDSTINHFLGN